MGIKPEVRAALEVIGAKTVMPRLGALHYVFYEVAAEPQPTVKVHIRRGQLYYEFNATVESANLEWLAGSLLNAFRFFESHEEVNNGQS